MTELAKEENLNKKLWLNSLKLFLKIALIMIAMFFFVIAILFYLAPKADAKIFNFFGLTKVEEKCYEQIYKNSGNTSDLYNLIIFDMEHDYFKQELNNIEKMFKAEDYEAFCKKLNASGIKSANGNKSLYPYVADTNSFFKSQQLRCEIKLGLAGKNDDWKDRAIKLILQNLTDDNLFDISFESSMNLIGLSDKLSVSEKTDFAKQLSQKIIDGKSFQEILNEKAEKIKMAEGLDEVQKILLKNAEVKLYAGQYYFEVMLSGGKETELALQILKNHTAALNEYKELISNNI